MAVISTKKRPVIKKGAGYIYIPETFAKEHAVANFYDTDRAEDVLNLIKPFEMFGRRFLVFDTETHPYFSSSQDAPPTVVRRWVGKGKQATPQDYPFCISICDGVNAITLYDNIDNGFKEFKKLEPLLLDGSIDKIAHNIKFDMHEIANAGQKIVGKLHDTVVLTKLANENRTSFQLRDIAATKDGGIVKFEYMVDNYKTMNKVKDYRMIPRELLTQYANADVWNAYLTFITEYPVLIEQGLEELYNNECEITVVLYEMERRGMKLDTDYEDTLKADLQQLTDEAERAIYAEAGKMFNINSSAQLYQVLMGLGVSGSLITMTDKGNPSLDKDALNRLANQHGVSIVKKILEYRKYEKLLGTYAVGIYDQRDSADRVHGSINQTEATTGRMSITKPALQTLPKKDKRIRRAFIPNGDNVLGFFDLDQVEYRIYGHYAIIPSLLDAIKNGYDVHAATAATIFNVDLEELVAKVHAGDEEANALRAKAKTINFALIYGVGQDHLAELLECTKTEAADTKAKYFSSMPEARRFINTVHSVIKARGFVKNLYGRRRRLGTDDCYKAPNALIQGCAADYIKVKTVDIYKFLKFNKLKTYMNNIVHDELLVEFDPTEMSQAPVIRYLMSDWDTFRCPITAGYEIGEPSWGQKVEPSDIGFKEPENTDYKQYDVFNGDVFDIYR